MYAQVTCVQHFFLLLLLFSHIHTYIHNWGSGGGGARKKVSVEIVFLLLFFFLQSVTLAVNYAILYEQKGGYESKVGIYCLSVNATHTHTPVKVIAQKRRGSRLVFEHTVR